MACVEGAQGWFIDLVRKGAKPDKKWLSAVVPNTVVRFKGDQGDLLLAIRDDFPHWRMPAKTYRQMEAARAFWSRAHLA
jgi:hypothetical protein